MITVAHVITKLEMGGAQENTLHTCRHLDRRRFRVTLIHGPGGYYDREARAIPDLDVAVVPDLVRQVSPARDARCLGALRGHLTRLMSAHAAAGGDPRAVIVHTHSSKAGVLGRVAARAAGVPRIVHTIHGFGFFDGQNALTRAAFIAAEIGASRLTDAFISVSRANLAEAQARGILRRGQAVAVIRSGFDLGAYFRAAGQRAEARRALSIDPEAEVILAIANLKPQKDPLTLVEAVRLLAARRPRAEVLYAGDGPLRGAVEAALARAGLATRFQLLGWREDIPELLAAADVVVLSSVFEGLPRSAVQALAAARPFVGTRVDGTSEIVRDGRNGFLVEPQAPAALADALERALIERPTDPADRERVLEWDADRMVQEQEALYERLVAAAPRDRADRSTHGSRGAKRGRGAAAA